VSKWVSGKGNQSWPKCLHTIYTDAEIE
jgi:hypothetical protein